MQLHGQKGMTLEVANKWFENYKTNDFLANIPVPVAQLPFASSIFYQTLLPTSFLVAFIGQARTQKSGWVNAPHLKKGGGWEEHSTTQRNLTLSSQLRKEDAFWCLFEL